MAIMRFPHPRAIGAQLTFGLLVFAALAAAILTRPAKPFADFDQAYYLTPSNGFRTFIKTDYPSKGFYEPFRDNASPQGAHATNRMIMNSYSLKLEEENRRMGLTVKISYTTIPGEPFAGLSRRLELINISGKRMEGSLLDGLPHITPYGMNAWHQKHMSRTIEAWMNIDNLKSKIPFYTLKVSPEDRPEIVHVEKANFYVAFADSGRSSRLLDVIVDPDTVFNRNGDISFPVLFGNAHEFRFPAEQHTEGKMPSALAYSRFSMAPGKSFVITSVAGSAKGIAAKWKIAQLLDININSVDLFKSKIT